MSDPKRANFSPTKEHIHEIIFEADTSAGKYFDIILMICIVASVIVVMLESISELNIRYANIFFILEWAFTIFFTVEYLLRIYCVYQPKKYMASFFGIVDLLAIIPTYLSLFITGTHYLLVIRALRLLRVFRIFKLANFLKESTTIMKALKASRPKITVFLFFIILMVTIIGSMMYLVESGNDSSFTSIPRSIYWAVVTLTTVGYGDIAPQTELGQFLAAIVMILGYAVIAVPTGIVSAEMVSQTDANKGTPLNTQSCQHCSTEGHLDDALFCRKCGQSLLKSH